VVFFLLVMGLTLALIVVRRNTEVSS